jgi:hypothetical protein
VFSAPRFRPFSQQSLASTTQQPDWSEEHASFGVQQLVFFATTLPEQQPATFAMAFAGPQQAFASLQQAKPSVQHFWTAAQQLLFAAQHFRPLSQQPSRAFASQQALFSLQQASLATQQSLGFSSLPRLWSGAGQERVMNRQTVS